MTISLFFPLTIVWEAFPKVKLKVKVNETIEMFSIFHRIQRNGCNTEQVNVDGFKFEICKAGKSLSSRILTSTDPLLHASYMEENTFWILFPEKYDIKIYCCDCWWHFIFPSDSILSQIFQFQEHLPLFVSVTLSEHWHPPCNPDMSTKYLIYWILELSTFLPSLKKHRGTWDMEGHGCVL